MKTPKAILFDLGGVLCELRGEAHMMKLLGGLQTREQMWRAWLASPAVRAHESGQLSEMEFAVSMSKYRSVLCDITVKAAKEAEFAFSCRYQLNLHPLA